MSSSNTNIKELESFFCQFWPNLCEKSAICDLNQNYSLPHLPQDLPPLDPHLSQDQEHNSLSIASSSLMLIIPDERFNILINSPEILSSLLKAGDFQVQTVPHNVQHNDSPQVPRPGPLPDAKVGLC